MPVRIYDISKKLGLENKEVLTKAKELGIAAARVASSSLDKITAEYLEQQLILAYPNSAPAAAPPALPARPPAPHEPILIVKAPEPEPPPEQEIPAAVPATSFEPGAPAEGTAIAAEAEAPAAPAIIGQPPKPPEPQPPAQPLPPPGPRVGDKVGFIQLPTKPGPKPPDKPPLVKIPARPGD